MLVIKKYTILFLHFFNRTELSEVDINFFGISYAHYLGKDASSKRVSQDILKLKQLYLKTMFTFPTEV